MIIGLPKAIKSKPPIIEIIGLPDTGKQILIKILSHKTNSTEILNPNYSGFSFTGLPLLQAMKKDVEFFQRNYIWLQHLWAAHICEIGDHIVDKQIANPESPIFITNYVNSWLLWSATYRRKSNYIKNFKRNIDTNFPNRLPKPDYIIILKGTSRWQSMFNIKIHLDQGTELLESWKALAYNTLPVTNQSAFVYDLDIASFNLTNQDNIPDDLTLIDIISSDILKVLSNKIPSLQTKEDDDITSFLESFFYTLNK